MLAIPSLVIGWFTVKPLSYGGWFGKAIKVLPGHDILAHMGTEFHGSLAMALDGITNLPFILVVVAFILCTWIYLFQPAMADRIRRLLNPFHVLLDRKFFFDEIYLAVFVRGGQAFGRLLWHGGDRGILDGVMVDGSTRTVERISLRVRRLQTGLLYHYAFAMIIGLILLLGSYWWFGGVW
jgi:NADH-quinone oxidoreductase subunit L